MTTEFVNSYNKKFTEKEKEKLINNFKKYGNDLLQCMANDNYDSISYNKEENCLNFETECECGYCGGGIYTDLMSNETIMSIIRILLDILQKRMQNKENEVKEND